MDYTLIKICGVALVIFIAINVMTKKKSRIRKSRKFMDHYKRKKD